MDSEGEYGRQDLTRAERMCEMSRYRWFVAAAVLLVAGPMAFGRENANQPPEAAREGDGQAFVRQHDLQPFNRFVMEFIALLKQGDPAEATKYLLDHAPTPEDLTEESVRSFRNGCVGLSGWMTQRTIESVELVAVLQVSTRAVLAFYVVSTDMGPMVMSFRLSRFKGVWKSSGFEMETNWEKFVAVLRDARRFEVPCDLGALPEKTAGEPPAGE